MTDTNSFIIRKMLKALIDIGPSGFELQDLKDFVNASSLALMTTLDMDTAIALMRAEGWIASFQNPVTKRVRWYISEQGKMAFAAL